MTKYHTLTSDQLQRHKSMTPTKSASDRHENLNGIISVDAVCDTEVCK